MVKKWTEEQIKEVFELYKTMSIRDISTITGHTRYSISILLKNSGFKVTKGHNGRNLTGNRFGKLVVVEDVGRRNRSILWRCECDCGGSKNVTSINLTTGKCKSCGCLQKEMASESNKTHGDSKTKLFMIWSDMRKRCSNKNHHAYKYYGEKGVKVDKEWNSSFITFKEWSLNNGYAIGLSIDRIDVNGNYEPSNCRWVTHKAQMNNTTRNNNILYNGKTQSLTDWCEELNLPYSRMRYRLKKIKMSPEEAFTTPRLSSKKYMRNTN